MRWGPHPTPLRPHARCQAESSLRARAMLTSPWFPRGLVQRLACVYRVLNKCLPVTTLPSWELNDPLHLPHAHRTGSLHSLDLSLSAHQEVCVGGARCLRRLLGWRSTSQNQISIGVSTQPPPPLLPASSPSLLCPSTPAWRAEVSQGPPRGSLSTSQTPSVSSSTWPLRS